MPKQPTYYPGVEEEYEVSHDAFHKAFDDSKPEVLKVPGLQEFAAALWLRRSSIPSPTQKDPLLNIFDEFDSDNDGVLNAAEIAGAFRSHGININDEQVCYYINEFEENKATFITRCEFPEFVYSMAVADLHAHPELSDSSTDSCDLP